AGRSEANALVQDELAVAARSGRTYEGYCLYDRHVVEMMAEGALAFCFGPAATPRTYAQLWRQQTDIARKLVNALQKEGFQVEWSGRPADVVAVVGVDWSGPRNASGDPTIPVGVRLEGHASPSNHSDEAAPTNVFVSCAGGSPDAHRLVTAIARRTGSP